MFFPRQTFLSISKCQFSFIILNNLSATASQFSTFICFAILLLYFSQKVSRFKTRYKKTMRFTQCIVQAGMRLCKEMCNIEANIEYFAFLNCCNLTFSQIVIIIKFLKSFIKEGLNFSRMTLCEVFSYRKCEIFWLHSCIA